MRSVISVDPFRCRVWQLHDRLEDNITEQTCKTEIQSFLEHGQLIPVLGRRIAEADYDIELIYGARRLFAARHTKKPLLVELCELSDKEAIIAMDMENRHRQDLSPYERGLSYARWLRSGYFVSQEEMARALGVSASQVSRLLRLSRLPAVVLDAFETTMEICEGWGLDLAEALEDQVIRRALITKAREIARISPRPPARDVYRQLLTSAVRGRKPREAAHDTVITDEQGTPLFRVRRQRHSIALIVPIQHMSADSLESIQSALATILSSCVIARDTRRGLRTRRNGAALTQVSTLSSHSTDNGGGQQAAI